MATVVMVIPKTDRRRLYYLTVLEIAIRFLQQLRERKPGLNNSQAHLNTGGTTNGVMPRPSDNIEGRLGRRRQPAHKGGGHVKA
jgi:hypothetical protein